MVQKTTTIAIVAGSFPARSETFVINHAVGLAQRGYSVVVIGASPESGIAESEIQEIQDLGVTISRVSTFGRNRFANLCRAIWAVFQSPSLIRYIIGDNSWTRREYFEAMAVRRKMNALAPDLLHIHYGAKAAPLVKLGISIPVIVTWHGYDANRIPQTRGNDVYRDLFSYSHTHTVGSKFMENRLATLGAEPEKVVKIPMGVDISSFKHIRHEQAAPKRLKVISVGRLSEEKGHDTLIKAVNRLISQGLDVSLEIIGDGPMLKALQQQIELTQTPERFSLRGSLPNLSVREELSNFDVFALTGRVAASGSEESQGLALVEAQAAGLPVVACDIGGVSETIQNGVSGILCKSEHVEDVSEALRFLLSNPNARAKFGMAGRDYATKRFSISQMLDHFILLYDRHLSSGSSLPS